MKSRIVAIMLTSISFFFPRLAGAECSGLGQGWKSLKSGACYSDYIVTHEGRQYPFRGFRFDMASYSIKLVRATEALRKKYDALRSQEDEKDKSETRSLSDYFDFTASEIFNNIPIPASVVSSIGYPLFPGDPIPRGLLKINGKKESETVVDGSSFKYLTGVLCFDEKYSKHIRREVTAPILYAVHEPGKKKLPRGSRESKYQWKEWKCNNAVQVGPRIIEKGDRKEGIYWKVKNQSAPRLVLWLGSDDGIYLGYWDDIDLFTLQSILLSGQLGEKSIPEWAANLGVRELAGFHSKNLSAGNTDATNAAFLIFSPRKAAAEGN